MQIYSWDENKIKSSLYQYFLKEKKERKKIKDRIEI